MKCEYCGNELDVNSTKCAKCGAPVPENSVQSNSGVTAPKVSIPNEVKFNNISNNGNKQNKKKKNVFIPIFIGVIIIAVVAALLWFFVFNKDKNNESSTTDVKNDIKSAANNMKSLENYTMDLNVNMDMNYNGTNGSLAITGTFKIDEKNKTYSMNINVFDENFEMYGQYNDDSITIYQYDSYSDVWTKNESTLDINSSEVISDLILDSTNISKVDSDEKGLTKYKVTFDTSKLNQLTDSTELAGIYDLDDTIPNKINMYVYINSDNYVEKIYIDLLEMLNNTSLITDEYSFDDLSITITFSKFNTTGNVTIPKEVIENAVSSDDLLEYNMTYDEEDIMYDIVLSASVYCEEGTIDFANYNGELDTLLELDSYDLSSITEGIITIDNECDVVVQKDFKINDKTCTYDDENYESCK